MKEVVDHSGLQNSNLVTSVDENSQWLRITELIPVLTKAIQEQQVQIEALKQEIKVLKKRQGRKNR